MRAAICIIAASILGCSERVGCKHRADEILPPRSQVSDIRIEVVDVRDTDTPAGHYRVKMDKWEAFFEYIQPDREVTEMNTRNMIFPIVCYIILKTGDGDDVRLSIREMGDNPLVLSRREGCYFWAKRRRADGVGSAVALLDFVGKNAEKPDKLAPGLKLP